MNIFNDRSETNINGINAQRQLQMGAGECGEHFLLDPVRVFTCFHLRFIHVGKGIPAYARMTNKMIFYETGKRHYFRDNINHWLKQRQYPFH